MDRESLLRKIPSIDFVVNEYLNKNHNSDQRDMVVEVVRIIISDLRLKILSQQLKEASLLEQNEILKLVEKKLGSYDQKKLHTLINATGVVLHTNLGRAILCQSGIEAVQQVAANYSNLEFDLESGQRGSRYSHLEEHLCRLTGAEAALVVNNNASAVLLTLASLGKDKEAIVSRGELVEIGGSFRIPDVMKQSGVGLVEVGTTNKTYINDYEQAITDNTGLLLKVHTSNYRIIGFTKEATRQELVKLGEKFNIPVVEDLGSGFLADLSSWGITDEPKVQDCVASGVDIITFSGDKLLGGPQAGIIVGKKQYIDRLKKHPLTRAVRIDKFTVAALEATLREYLDKKELNNIPTLAMITMEQEEIANRAKDVAKKIKDEIGDLIKIEIIQGNSMVGGGALPTTNLPTKLIAITSTNFTSQQIAENLRTGDNKVIVRVQSEQILVDLRTVFSNQEDKLIEKLVAVIRGEEK